MTDEDPTYSSGGPLPRGTPITCRLLDDGRRRSASGTRPRSTRRRRARARTRDPRSTFLTASSSAFSAERLRQDDAALGARRSARAQPRAHPRRQRAGDGAPSRRRWGSSSRTRTSSPGGTCARTSSSCSRSSADRWTAEDRDSARGDRPRRLRDGLPARALGRHAAAGFDRASARAGSCRAAHGRAVRPARRVHPRRDEPATPSTLVGDAGRRSSSSPTTSAKRSSSPTASS